MAKATTIAEYIKALAPERAETAKALHELVVATLPKATSSIKWAQPVYDSDGPAMFMRASRNHVTLGFWRGKELTDPKAILEGDGDRMAHIKVTSSAEIPKTQLVKWIKEAAALNKKLGDPTKRMKK